ncbi:MAG: HEAT repeat domain-containing protein [Planctomycetota bacterium]
MQQIRFFFAWFCFCCVIGHAQEDIKKLIDDLKNSSEVVRYDAVKALGFLGADAREAIPVLIETLFDNSYDVRITATDTLAGMGTVAIPALIEALCHENEIGKMSIVALRKIGSEAVTALSKELNFPEAERRRRALWAFSDFGKEAKEAVPAIILQLKDPEVNHYAVFALETMGEFAQQAIPELTQLLHKAPQQTAWRIVETLGAIGPPAIPSLMIALDSSDSQVQIKAILALEAMGEKAIEAAPSLQKLLQSPDRAVQFYAAETLILLGIDTPEVFAPFIECLSENQPYFQKTSLILLAQLGAKAKDSAPSIILMFDNHYLQIQRAAIDALVSIGKSSVPFLIEALSSPSPQISTLASVTLARIGKEAIPSLLQTLKNNPNQEVCDRILFILEETEAEIQEAIPILMTFLQNKDLSVQRKVATILEEFHLKEGTPVPKEILLKKEIEPILPENFKVIFTEPHIGDYFSSHQAIVGPMSKATKKERKALIKLYTLFERHKIFSTDWSFTKDENYLMKVMRTGGAYSGLDITLLEKEISLAQYIQEANKAIEEAGTVFIEYQISWEFLQGE